MSLKTIIYNIIAFFSLVILIYIILFWRDQFIALVSSQSLNLFYAIVMAIIVGLAINYIYRKYSRKSKILKTTVTPPRNPNKILAKLILKENHEYIIKEYERIFGREDFLGVAVPDDLLYIGKEHFKIFRQDDGYYIEDLNTKNGTKLNGEEIKGKERKKLENEDQIIVASTLNIRYKEE